MIAHYELAKQLGITDDSPEYLEARAAKLRDAIEWKSKAIANSRRNLSTANTQGKTRVAAREAKAIAHFESDLRLLSTGLFPDEYSATAIILTDIKYKREQATA